MFTPLPSNGQYNCISYKLSKRPILREYWLEVLTAHTECSKVCTKRRNAEIRPVTQYGTKQAWLIGSFSKDDSDAKDNEL